MKTIRRDFLKKAAVGGAAVAAAPLLKVPGFGAQEAGAATFKKRITGADMYTASRWGVAGTDLGIPYVLENGSIGYLFGDTFSGAWPGSANWRSPVMLRSAVHPGAAGGIVFDSAAKVSGNGLAPEIMKNGHNGIGIDGVREVTVIPNDGISFPETGRQLVSYMSIDNWNQTGTASWKSNYAGLAYSDNGNDFYRISQKWWNNSGNTDPYQMWTMQRMGDYVYVFSVRAGRQDGPMMLRRVRWDKMFDMGAYQGWGWNGSNWGWGRPCTPILNGRFGEPSVKRLSDGTWAMCYLNASIGCIVTRTASAPDSVWSNEKVQLFPWDEPSMYGGFIHPWSKKGTNNLHIMVSRWSRDLQGNTNAYHVSQWQGTL